MSAPADENLRIMVIEKLIELGADVNFIGLVPSWGPYPIYQQSGTPLHAYYASGIKAVSVLLDNGADASLKNSHGLDAIDFFKMYVGKITSESEANEILQILERRFPNLSKNKFRGVAQTSPSATQRGGALGEPIFSVPLPPLLLKAIAGIFGSILGAYISTGVGLLGAAIIMLIVGFLLIPIAFFVPKIYEHLEAVLMAICSLFIVIGTIMGFYASINATKNGSGVAITSGIAFGAIALVAVAVQFDFVGIIFEPFKAVLSLF
jgi:hypothetical protein